MWMAEEFTTSEKTRILNGFVYFNMYFTCRQNEMVVELHREREEQMRLLTSQLLLLEANLRAKQGKIDGLLNQRDRVISNQQETIRSLERELDRCRISSVQAQQHPSQKVRPQSLPITSSSSTDSVSKTAVFVVNDKTECNDGSATSADRNRTQPRPAVRVLGREQGDESLDDSDSAVVIDDDHRHSPTFLQNSQVLAVVNTQHAHFHLFSEKMRMFQPTVLESIHMIWAGGEKRRNDHDKWQGQYFTFCHAR